MWTVPIPNVADIHMLSNADHMPIRGHCKWLIYMGQDRSGPYCAAGMRAASRQLHIATKHRDARGLL